MRGEDDLTFEVFHQKQPNRKGKIALSGITASVPGLAISHLYRC